MHLKKLWKSSNLDLIYPFSEQQFGSYTLATTVATLYPQ